MTYPNPSTAVAETVVDELTRNRVRLVVAAPGSRSTALVLAASRHPGLELVMATDERSAAFHALGWAKAVGEPAAVMTTSGTAVANLLPAVVEADSTDSPLVVVSADRPPEMRRVGANQAIDQRDIFGTFVRTSVELGPGEPEPSAPGWWRSIVSQALGEAAGFSGRPGPVHLNVAFREPTVGVSHDGRTAAEPYPFDSPGRAGDEPWSDVLVGRRPGPDLIERLAAWLAPAERGLIVAGSGSGDRTPIAALGRHLGWPVLATAESGLRGQEGVISTGHHLAERAEPDRILRFGDPGPSRRVLELVSRPIPQVVVGDRWLDPGRVAARFVSADPPSVAEGLMAVMEARPKDRWTVWWQEGDQAVVEALAPELAARLSEPAVAAVAARSGADLLAVASSMPIRDVEAYAFSTPPIIGNRGASGIDGFVSTALGAARTGAGTVALAGDLSMLHDANGFLIEDRPPCVFVVVDNGGGGIFSFLPQYEHAGEGFDRLFTTPHGRDLEKLAAFHDLGFHRAGTVEDLSRAIADAARRQACALVVVETDRDDNVAEHMRLNRIAAEAVASLGEPPP